MNIKFQPPDKDSPGYLKRARSVLQFQEALESNQLTVKVIENLVDFLVDFVVEPADREEARGALWEASEKQFVEMLGSLGGADNEDPLSEQSG